MQTVSAEWKQAMLQNIVPESFIEVSYKVGDPDADGQGTVTDNGEWSGATSAEIANGLDKNYRKFATLEPNMWKLDGTFDIYSGSPSQSTGYISDVFSEDDATFTTHPVITITLPQVYTNPIPGITIQWSETYQECARDFIVTVYDSGSPVVTETITGNTDIISVIETEISSYDEVQIEIVEWCLPQRRARIEDIYLGVKKIFQKGDLLGFEHSQNVDLISSVLPKSQVVFQINNVDGEWNPDNPTGVMKYLEERQQVSVRYGYKISGGIEWIKAGTFFLSEWETPSNGISASFTARDLFEFMGNPFAATDGTFTLYALALQAITQANLPTFPDGTDRYYIDSSLSSISATIQASDFSYSIGEVLQMCANAACCVMYQNRDGKIMIEPFANVLSDYIIDEFVSYQNAEYEISKELQSVNVNDGAGNATNGTTGEVQTISNPLIQNSSTANSVAAWIRDCIKGRKTLSGDYRAGGHQLRVGAVRRGRRKDGEAAPRPPGTLQPDPCRLEDAGNGRGGDHPPDPFYCGLRRGHHHPDFLQLV